MKNTHLICATAASALLAPSGAHAQETGRQLTTVDVIDNADGSSTVNLIPQRWDDRCAGNIAVTINTAALPNSGVRPPFLGARVNPVLTVDQTADAFREALAQWNNNPSSYINMEVESARELPSLLDRPTGLADLTMKQRSRRARSPKLAQLARLGFLCR